MLFFRNSSSENLKIHFYIRELIISINTKLNILNINVPRGTLLITLKKIVIVPRGTLSSQMNQQNIDISRRNSRNSASLSYIFGSYFVKFLPCFC